MVNAAAAARSEAVSVVKRYTPPNEKSRTPREERGKFSEDYWSRHPATADLFTLLLLIAVRKAPRRACKRFSADCGTIAPLLTLALH